MEFKVNGEIKMMTVSQRQMAAALGLSTTRINELINEGILIRDESTAQGRLMLYDSLQNFFLSKRTTSEGVNFWQEKSLHEKAKRELAELKLRARRGEIYEAATIDSAIFSLLTDLRNKLMGLGHKTAPLVEHKEAAQICALLDSEINAILEELSESVEEVATSVEAAAEDDG